MTESFQTTRWTRVIAAKGDETALSELCEAYYAPIHAYLQHTVRDLPEDGIRDLTHAFFEQLLQKPGLDSLERGRGKFRSYLLGAVKHFLANWRTKKAAQKRAGDSDPKPVDESNTSVDATDDRVYDRKWALAILARGLAALSEKTDHSEQFAALKPWLTGDYPKKTQAEVAHDLGMSESAVKVAIHRLRKRFRECVKTEIAHTVASKDAVAEELSYFIEVLGHHG